jgi:hypothetical protein
MWTDTGEAKHLFNALKYLLSLSVTGFALAKSLFPLVPYLDTLWCRLPSSFPPPLISRDRFTVSAVATAYSFYWDVVMDWFISSAPPSTLPPPLLSAHTVSQGVGQHQLLACPAQRGALLQAQCLLLGELSPFLLPPPLFSFSTASPAGDPLGSAHEARLGDPYLARPVLCPTAHHPAARLR